MLRTLHGPRVTIGKDCLPIPATLYLYYVTIDTVLLCSGDGAGDPNSPDWYPAETDFTVLDGDT